MGQGRGHLTRQEREAYLAGALAPLELLAVDAHVQACDECMTTMAAERNEPPMVSVNELTDVEDEHLSFEQMSGHVDGRLDAVDSSIVELHLEDCAGCRREVAGLRAVRDEMQGAREVRSGPVPFWRSWKLLVPAFGVLAAVAIFWLARPGIEPGPVNDMVALPLPEGTPPPAPTDLPPASPTPTQERSPELASVLNDAGGTIGIDEKGEIAGVAALPPRMRDAVKHALSDGAVAVGQGVERAGGGVLMGNAEGVPFGLAYPVGEVVLPQRPRFRWKPAAGATAYRVRVFDDAFNEVLSSPEITGTQWNTAKALPRGRSYRWQVTATVDGKEVMSPVRPAPDAVFRIVDSAAAEDIEAVKRQHPNSDLLLGLAYARAGMRAEAEREFNSLLRRNPNSETARRLLRQVRSGR